MSKTPRPPLVVPPRPLTTKAEKLNSSAGQAAIRRAEAAVEKVRQDLTAAMFHDMDRMSEARRDLALRLPVDAIHETPLYHLCFEIKGLAGSLGHELIGKICASLCDLLEHCPQDHKDYLAAVSAHLQALKLTRQQTFRDPSEAGEIVAGLRRIVLKMEQKPQDAENPGDRPEKTATAIRNPAAE